MKENALPKTLVAAPEPLSVSYSTSADSIRREVTIDSRVLVSDRPRVGSNDLNGNFSEWWGSYVRGERHVADRSEQPFRFMDLFSSVGGLSLGAMDAIASVGRRPVPLLAADLDNRALQVYKSNIRPREIVNESIRGMLDFRVAGFGEDARFAYSPTVIDPRLAAHVGAVDLILAGPPCQGHSSLNNHSRHEDPKNLLYLTVPAAAIALGARHIIIENVPNVVADRHGVVRTTIALLEKSGYSVSFGTLQADKIGWPQTRKRFFLVASLGSKPLDLHSLASAMNSAPMPVTWLLDDLADKKLNDAEVMNSVPKLSAENRDRVDWLHENNQHTLPNELRPDCHKNGTTYPATYGRMYADQPAPTITGGFLTPGRGRFVHPNLPRVMTPREAARIQGFPDWFDFVPNPKVPPSRTEISKWIGNAVPSILGYVATLAAVHSESASPSKSAGLELATAAA